VTKRPPDLEIAARVRAEEVRFECKPEVRVVASADWPTVAESVSERENLPEELQTGVTYRDFEVRWRAWARLEDPAPDSEVVPDDPCTWSGRDISSEEL
jgi:hypothetical protein